MVGRTHAQGLYAALKAHRYRFDPKEIVGLFGQVSEERVDQMADTVAGYIRSNLPQDRGRGSC